MYYYGIVFYGLIFFQEYKKMKYDLEEEKKVRRRLEISIKKFMKSNNFIWEEMFIQVYYQGFKFDKYV